ncbi:MAG: hypothetical protein QXI05_02950 [Candidatus Bathyarchaeia archaeon]
MIRVKQVFMRAGETIVRVEADFPDASVRLVDLDYAEIEDRLRQVRLLLGREPTEQDLIDVIRAIVNRMREGKLPVSRPIQLEQLIGLDIESGA